MTKMLCRQCGDEFVLKSKFEGQCTECGSEDIEPVDAYDPVEHELRCEYCGYEIDTSVSFDPEWDDEEDERPGSIDDPCPLCGAALVPAGNVLAAKPKPEYGLAIAAARKLHADHDIPGPPYLLDNLASTVGLRVEVGPFAHDGMLVGETVEIPHHVTPDARRFLLAHEVAHHVMRHDGDRDKVEPEANALASELLAPRKELKKLVEMGVSLRQIRLRFGISRQASVYAVMAAKLIGRVKP